MVVADLGRFSAVSRLPVQRRTWRLAVPLPTRVELVVLAVLAVLVAVAARDRTPALPAVALIDGEPILAERLQPLLVGLTAESGVTATAGRAALVDALIDEELLVRHARRLGLGADDPLIRRRLMHIVLEATTAGLGEPSAAETADWYATHVTRWASSGAVRLRMAAAPDGVAWPPDAAALRSARGTAPWMHDDRAWWPTEQLTDLYGPEFSTAVLTAPLGTVIGPLGTSVGPHFVLVEERRDAGPRPLAEVAVAVEADWRETRRRAAVVDLLERLRAESSIVIVGRP